MVELDINFGLYNLLFPAFDIMVNREVWMDNGIDEPRAEVGINPPEFELTEAILPGYDGHRKDPCIVAVPTERGVDEHIFTSHGAFSAVGCGGEGGEEKWTIGHYYRPAGEPHWELLPDIQLEMPGEHIAAPSIVYDESGWQMVVHETFLENGGNLVIARSQDGHHFYDPQVIVRPQPETGELGLYDPHFMLNCEFMGLPRNSVITYSGGVMQKTPYHYIAEVEARLAVLTNGEWLRKGIYFPHEQIPRHNKFGVSDDVEWGTEGTQLFHTGEHLCGVGVRFKDKYLLGRDTPIPRGMRQELFLYVSLTGGLDGRYVDLGIDLYKNMQGEYGHASVHIQDGFLYIYYQYRYTKDIVPDAAGKPLYCISEPWNVGVARYPLREFDHYVAKVRQGYSRKLGQT